MENPFELIENRLAIIESKLDSIIDKIDPKKEQVPTWISSKQLAQLLGISVSSVTKLRGSKLPYYKLGGRIFFKKEEIDEYIETTRHKSGSEYLNEHLKIK